MTELEIEKISQGQFVVFEGGDRVGKSTQIALFAKHVQENLKRKVRILRFPDRSR